jgi:integrase-like protein
LGLENPIATWLGRIPGLTHYCSRRPGSGAFWDLAGAAIAGHVFRVDRTRAGLVRRVPAADRLAGPAQDRPSLDRTGAAAGRLCDDAARGGLAAGRAGPGAPGDAAGDGRHGATFADAAAAYLRYVEHDRERKPWTLRGYRSVINAHLLPAFGSMAIEDVTTEAIEAWIATVEGAIRTRNKLLILLHGIMRRARKVYGLPCNAAAEGEKYLQRRSGDIDVFSPEEVWAPVRAAESDQDAAIFLTAAFTGLRQAELLALRWRDVDFAGSVVRVRGSYGLGEVTTPKSGKVRSVPLAPDVAEALTRLARKRRKRYAR